MPFKITYPRTGNIIRTNHGDGKSRPRSWYFVASGLLDDPGHEITGSCTHRASGHSTPGTRIYLTDDHGRVLTDHWYLYFDIPRHRAGDHKLTVEERDAEDNGYSQSLNVHIGGEPHFDTNVMWPSECEDVADYIDSFTPYGDLDAPINTLTLKYPPPSFSANTVTRLGKYEDPSGAHYWVAQFATLPNNQTFELYLSDTKLVPTIVQRHCYTTTPDGTVCTALKSSEAKTNP